jgi:hypothetical protein
LDSSVLVSDPEHSSGGLQFGWLFPSSCNCLLLWLC